MPEFLRQTFVRYYSPLFLPSLLRIVGMVLVSMFILRLIDSALRRLRLISPGELMRVPRAEQRVETLGSIIRSVAKVLLVVFVGLTAAQEVGYDIGPLLASVSIAGVAIGFGAQSLVKDIISGFFILFEDQYGVGDVIRTGTLAGEVERMSLRSTTLRNTEGHVHVIPNGSIQTVTVLTKEWSRALVDVVVGYGEDIDRVIRILQALSERLQADWPDRLTERPSILGVENLGQDGVTIRCIVKTPPSKQWEVAREWRKRIKGEFDREGIALAGGQQTVWLQGEPEAKPTVAAKKTPAPPPG